MNLTDQQLELIEKTLPLFPAMTFKHLMFWVKTGLIMHKYDDYTLEVKF